MNQRHWSVWFETVHGRCASVSVFADTIEEAVTKAVESTGWALREQCIAAGWYDCTYLDELAMYGRESANSRT